MADHRCPGPGCQRQVPQSKLMCSTCWYQVPKPLRDAVYAAWDHGRGAGSPAHRAAIQAAIKTLTPAGAPGA